MKLVHARRSSPINEPAALIGVDRRCLRRHCIQLNGRFGKRVQLLPAALPLGLLSLYHLNCKSLYSLDERYHLVVLLVIPRCQPHQARVVSSNSGFCNFISFIVAIFVLLRLSAFLDVIGSGVTLHLRDRNAVRPFGQDGLPQHLDNIPVFDELAVFLSKWANSPIPPDRISYPHPPD